MAVSVGPGSVVLYTDVACPWSVVALHRFYAARREAGLAEELRVDHRLFLLEDLNRRPVQRRDVEAEILVVAGLAPELGLRHWQAEPSTWPVTALPANEAVHAAKLQSLAAAEELDMAVRLAFFRDSRPISLLHELVDIADECDGVDADQLRRDLDGGRARGPMMRDYREHHRHVQGSPHFFLADGSDVHNPGLTLHWEGANGASFPVVDSFEPGAFKDLVRQAAAPPAGDGR